MGLRWVVTDPGTFKHHDGRTYKAGSWTIRKEFYADGPSLFTYVVCKHGVPVDVGYDFGKLRQAKAYVEAQTGG